MPYPQNVETARMVEAIVRDNGAEPATIAIIDGELQIGLDDKQLERLAIAGKRDAIKTSRRDLANVLVRSTTNANDRRVVGATTVSGTMALAHMAGIKVFVTGGIGGVHRDGQHTFDISADLTELGRTPVAVVCAGVKSILDIGRTLEYLETQGVPVVTVAPADRPYFPAFYVPTSPFKVRADFCYLMIAYIQYNEYGRVRFIYTTPQTVPA
jgi:pseudouridine-5'-phosphate glycosidase